MHTEGPGIWRKKLKITENEKYRNTLLGRKYGAGKTEKGGKFRNVHCRTTGIWQARKLKIMENEKHPLDDLKMTQITKKRENEKCNTEGPGIWREN